MSATDAPVRVAIVDDHPMFSLGLAAAIAEMPGAEFVGEAMRASEVADLIARTSPDVILLDIGLPDVSGLEVNRWLAAEHPEVRVVILTMSEDVDTAITALRDGARGFVVKGAGPDRVEQAIRTAVSGDVVVDQVLVQGIAETVQSRRAANTRPFPLLTDREFEILELIAAGLANSEIARRLVVNPKTVRNHVSNVFAKLNTSDRASAIVLAHRHGIGI